MVWILLMGDMAWRPMAKFWRWMTGCYLQISRCVGTAHRWHFEEMMELILSTGKAKDAKLLGP